MPEFFHDNWPKFFYRFLGVGWDKYPLSSPVSYAYAVYQRRI